MGNCQTLPLPDQSEITAMRRRRTKEMKRLERSRNNSPHPSSPLTLEELRRIRVINMADGSVVDLPNPMPASDLNIRNPNLLVCDAESLRPGNRPCPLRPAAHLAPGHLYILLPLAAFQRPLDTSYLDAVASLIAPAPTVSSSSHLRRVFPLPTSDSVLSVSVWPCNISKSSCIDASPPVAAISDPYIPFANSKSQSRPNSTINASTKPSSYTHPIYSWSLPGTNAFNASSCPFNVCGDSADALSRYIEQLIERGNPWMPKLDTIQESHHK